MTKLVCITNPSIVVTAPDEVVTEVGGNCWQVGGPQPLTYPKHLWRREEQPSLPSDLDEAAEEHSKQAFNGLLVVDNIDAFKAGAEWMAEQGQTVEGTFHHSCGYPSVIELKTYLREYEGADVIVQIRKKEE